MFALAQAGVFLPWPPGGAQGNSGDSLRLSARTYEHRRLRRHADTLALFTKLAIHSATCVNRVCTSGSVLAAPRLHGGAQVPSRLFATQKIARLTPGVTKSIRSNEPTESICPHCAKWVPLFSGFGPDFSHSHLLSHFQIKKGTPWVRYSVWP